MSTVGVDAVRSFVRTTLKADNSDPTALFLSTNENRIHGVIEDVARDEGPWPRLIMRVSAASSDASSDIVIASVTLTAETDWSGDLEDRGLGRAHAIINRVRAVLDGAIGTAADSESVTWRFSPAARVQGSQGASQRVGTQRNAVSETYVIVGTSGAAALRVQGESSITSTGMTTGMGIEPNGWDLSRTARLVDVTPVGVVSQTGAYDNEKKMAVGLRAYSGRYSGVNVATTPTMPVSGGTITLKLSDSDNYSTTDGLFQNMQIGAANNANGTVQVNGTIHLNPGVIVSG